MGKIFVIVLVNNSFSWGFVIAVKSFYEIVSDSPWLLEI